jgi:hypothetical protein
LRWPAIAHTEVSEVNTVRIHRDHSGIEKFAPVVIQFIEFGKLRQRRRGPVGI